MAALANSYVGNWAFGYSPDHGEHGIHTTFYMGQKAAKLGLAEAYLMQNRNIDDLRFAATLIENQRILDRNMANFHRQLGQHADADFIADDNKQVEILHAKLNAQIHEMQSAYDAYSDEELTGYMAEKILDDVGIDLKRLIESQQADI